MAIFSIKRDGLFFISVVSIVMVLFLNISCSNDFLEAENDVPMFETGDTIFATNLSQSLNVEVPLRMANNNAWRLVQYPQWIEIEPKSGFSRENTNVTFHITIKPERFYNSYGYYFFNLIFDIEGEGLESKVFAYYNFGNPEIEVNPNSLSLKDWQNGEITISNKGDGMLMWEIAAAPDWLNFEVIQGSNERYTDYQLKYTVDATNLDPGDYTDTITISNTANAGVQLPVSLNVGPVIFDGNYYRHELVQSVFIKETNTMVVLTSNPNQLMYFSPGERSPKIVKLDRVPQCMALNRAEGELVLGFSNTEITIYDAQSGMAGQTYKVNGVPKSVEYGPEGYIYYLANVNSWNYLHRFNIDSKVVNRSSYYLQGAKGLQFIPDKNMFLTNKPGYSPDMLIFLSADKDGEINLDNTYHTRTSGFWLSEKKDKIFTVTGKIFDVPNFSADTTFFTDDPNLSGEFGLDNNRYVDCIAHHWDSNRFFVSSQSYGSGSSRIKVFNYNTFALQNTYEFESVRPKDFPIGTTWWHKTLAIYPASDGSKLWLIQQHPGYSFYEPDIWNIATLKLGE